MCTGITARVSAVIAFSKASGLIVSVAGSISTSTGVAPVSVTALAVAIKVKSGTTTSSPCPIPSAANARKSAEVPLVTPTAYVAPTNFAISCSNCVVTSPSFR